MANQNKAAKKAEQQKQNEQSLTSLMAAISEAHKVDLERVKGFLTQKKTEEADLKKTMIGMVNQGVDPSTVVQTFSDKLQLVKDYRPGAKKDGIKVEPLVKDYYRVLEDETKKAIKLRIMLSRAKGTPQPPTLEGEVQKVLDGGSLEAAVTVCATLTALLA